MVFEPKGIDAFEVVPLSDLLLGLIYGVVYFLQVDACRDVEA